METFLRRNFKVEGNIVAIYKPGETTLLKLIEGIEVKLWHKAPMEKIFLASGLTDAKGDYTINFEISSPVNYIVDGKISDVFLEAYYNGTKLEVTGSSNNSKRDEISGTPGVEAKEKPGPGTLPPIQ